MAGPGGGPPRKSHTKSRKGCKTCKRRHIRCDESFPQCRNCTKHSTRCDYMDSPPPADEPARSPNRQSISLASSVEAEIEFWWQTGSWPFPEIQLSSVQQYSTLTKSELRLVHNLAMVYCELQRQGLTQYTPWVEKLPSFLDAAGSFDFVLSAVLAFSATHFAAESQNPETSNLAYHHRGVALAGMNAAIGNFSIANSDPILAASILLAWQASDWGGWYSLMAGVSTVLASMESWKDGSPLAWFVENHVLSQAQPLMPPTLGGLMAPMIPEDDQSLHEAIHALRQLLTYLRTNAPLFQFAEEMLRTAEDIEVSSRTTREEVLFDKLQHLRMRLLWAPIRLVQEVDHSESNLLVIAHLYALAMAVDASLPELNGAALGALANSPIDEIDRRIRFNSPQSFDSSTASVLDDLMRFPRLMAHKGNMNRRSIAGGSVGVPEPALSGRNSPYGFGGGGLHPDSAPHTPNFPPTFPSFMGGNISAEDLSVPPSPFLSSYAVPVAGVQQQGHPGSRRHSGLIETIHHSRPNSMNFDRRSFSALGYRDDSPSYSPAGYSPAHSFVETEEGLIFGDNSSPQWSRLSGNFSPSPSYEQPSLAYDESADKGKGRLL